MAKLDNQVAEYWAAAIERWRPDPVRFAWEAVGERPWSRQRGILDDLATHGKVSARSGHGVGKTFVEAMAIWWQMVCYDDSRILCTAPTAHQLWDILWAEVARMHRLLPPWIASQFRVTQDRLVMVAHEKTWFAVARTARPEKPEGLQGFHQVRDKRMMVICEEASGIPEAIYEVIEGALTTPGARALMMGNPTRPVGYFHATHTVFRDQWACHRISCVDAPARIVNPAYAENIAKRYGLESNVYRVRVLGEFPRSEDDTVVPLEHAEAALTRDLPDDFFLLSRHQVTIQVDVARFGADDTVISAKQGRAVLGVWPSHGNDLAVTAGRAAAIAKRIHGASEERHENGDVARPAYYPRIFVDATGLGAGVADILRTVELPGDERFTVVDVQAGENAQDDQFERMRDKLWWGAREFFMEQAPVIAPEGTTDECDLASWSPLNPRIARDARERLTAELSIPKYKFRPNGKIHVESKDEVKERIGGEMARSPDAADSLNLSFAHGAVLKPEPLRGKRWERRLGEADGFMAVG